eukprot:SAG11_NODE_7559_length_1129_cov_1.299029_3_plen_81_part_00
MTRKQRTKKKRQSEAHLKAVKDHLKFFESGRVDRRQFSQSQHDFNSVHSLSNVHHATPLRSSSAAISQLPPDDGSMESAA